MIFEVHCFLTGTWLWFCLDAGSYIIILTPCVKINKICLYVVNKCLNCAIRSRQHTSLDDRNQCEEEDH